jgi:regulator of nucleoside diphosphate kinase
MECVMHATIHGERTLSQPDFARLGKLPGLDLQTALADLLDSAELTAADRVPPDLVTMNARVEIVDVHTRRRQTLTVCYPEEASPSAGLISVLSPVGCSLLGLRVGDTARWQTPTGETCAAEIVAVLYQPEADADAAAPRAA